MATVRPLPWATLTIPASRAINNVGSSADARQLSVAGSRTIVRLTYGQDRIGGDILNVLPVTTGSTELLIQVLWGFAGSAVSDIRLNGQALPGTATVTTYLGTQTTTDAALVTAFAAQSITYADTLQGFAYSVIRLPQSAVGTELQITGLFSGRLLYDPRKDSTAGGTGSHRLNTPSTWEYSDNPALALGNFLHNTVYGASETVDWASVATTANANDANVGSPAEKRRLIGVTFTSAASVADTAETLRAYAGCFLIATANGVKLLPDADESPVATYAHADGSIAAISPLQLRDLGNSPTSVEIIYTDTTVIPWRDGSAFADLPGSGTTLPYRLSQVRLPGVKRYSQARREAIERLNKLTLQDLSTTIEVFDIGIRHQRGDIIRLTHPIGVTNKLFRITDIEAANAGRWLLTLIEHDPACYSSVVETVPTYANSGALISEAEGGGSGISSYMIEIYTQAATQPATPSGGSYTFVGDVFVPPGTPAVCDPGFSQNALLLRFNGNLIDDTGKTFSADGTTFVSPGKFNQAVSIGGTSGTGGGGNVVYLVTPTSDLWLDGGDFTIEGWCKNNATTTGRPRTLIRLAYGSGSDYLQIVFEGNGLNAGTWRFGYRDSAGTLVSYDSGQMATTGQWRHLAMTRQGNTLRFFVDGVLYTSVTSTHRIASQAISCFIGNSQRSFVDALHGEIDDVRIKKGVALYTATFTPPAAEFAPVSCDSIWSRNQPAGSTTPTWASRYLAQTTTPDVAIEIPAGYGPGNRLNVPLDSVSYVDTVIPAASITATPTTTPTLTANGVRFLTNNNSNLVVLDAGSGGKLSFTDAAKRGKYVVQAQLTFETAAASGSGDTIRFFWVGAGFFQAGFSYRYVSGITRLTLYASLGSITDIVLGYAPPDGKYTIEINTTGDSSTWYIAWFINDVEIRREVTSSLPERYVIFGAANGDARGMTAITYADLIVNQGDVPGLAWSVPNKHVQDGEGGAVLSLQATANVFTFNGAGAPTPTSQTITFTAEYASITGTPSFTATRFDASGASLGAATLGGSGDTRTLTIANFGAAARCVVSVTVGSYTDTVTVVRLQDGSGSVVGLLTNESVTVAAAADGTVASFAGTGGTFLVFDGVTDKTGDAGVTYSVQSETGVDVSIASTGVYSVASMSAATGFATFRAVYGGVTIDKVYSIAKSIAGQNAVTSSLSQYSYIFAVPNGFVGPTAPVSVQMNVFIGNIDDSANWTFSKIDSAGVTSTLTGNTVQVPYTPSVDSGYVEITATRASYPTQKQRFNFSNSVAVATGLTSFTLTAAAQENNTVAANAQVKLKPDGTTEYKNGDSAAWAAGANWFTPTTAGIGTSYAVRAILTGDALASGLINSVQDISVDRIWRLEAPIGGGAYVKNSNIEFRFEFDTGPNFAVLMTGYAYLQAAQEP